MEISNERFDSQLDRNPTYLHSLSAGAGEGTRTLNLRITNPMLYQLSYASADWARQNITDVWRAATARPRETTAHLGFLQ